MTQKTSSKAKKALAGVLIIVVISYGSYMVYSSFKQSTPPPPQQSLNFEPTPGTKIEQVTGIPIEPEISRQAIFTPSDSAKKIIKYEEQQSVQAARLHALTTQKAADDAAKKLKNNEPTPIATILEKMADKPKEPSLMDLIVIKSLVESGGQLIGMVSVGGELIQVNRKGQKIGNVTVVAMDKNSITLSDGRETKVRRIKIH
ncbi:hypothetical protein [Shewanella frigidimarina]|uniref:hypothetical protein n=1 Tax=Shewanella frigidimarina TaxID=56812 RepID=UPI003D78EEC6